jgi:hypothetical protein
MFTTASLHIPDSTRHTSAEQQRLTGQGQSLVRCIILERAPKVPGRDKKWTVLEFKATAVLVPEHFMKQIVGVRFSLLLYAVDRSVRHCTHTRSFSRLVVIRGTVDLGRMNIYVSIGHFAMKFIIL